MYASVRMPKCQCVYESACVFIYAPFSIVGVWGYVCVYLCLSVFVWVTVSMCVWEFPDRGMQVMSRVNTSKYLYYVIQIWYQLKDITCCLSEYWRGDGQVSMSIIHTNRHTQTQRYPHTQTHKNTERARHITHSHTNRHTETQRETHIPLTHKQTQRDTHTNQTKTHRETQIPITHTWIPTEVPQITDTYSDKDSPLQGDIDTAKQPLRIWEILRTSPTHKQTAKYRHKHSLRDTHTEKYRQTKKHTYTHNSSWHTWEYIPTTTLYVIPSVCLRTNVVHRQ